jgi:CRP-like cAMP-binding protein
MELKDVRLFKNTDINISNIDIREYPSNYTIEIEGDTSLYLGIILKGRVFVKAYSLAGKDFIISTLDPGMVFGDVLLFGTKSNTYPGNIITSGKTIIAVLPNDQVRYLIQTSSNFSTNYLSLLSDKVYSINHKSKLLSQDSVRDKILFYLHQEMKQQKNNKIQLNMSKEELANNLFMQRPSLSRELIKMREEGILDFDRWTITLK